MNIDENSKVKIGGAFATEAGNLKFKHIIHIVGPEWYGDGDNDEEHL